MISKDMYEYGHFEAWRGATDFFFIQTFESDNAINKRNNLCLTLKKWGKKECSIADITWRKLILLAQCK